jgi:hypothetical protein
LWRRKTVSLAKPFLWQNRFSGKTVSLEILNFFTTSWGFLTIYLSERDAHAHAMGQAYEEPLPFLKNENLWTETCASVAAIDSSTGFKPEEHFLVSKFSHCCLRH